MLRLNLIVFGIQNQTKKIMKPISEMSKDFNDYQNFMFRVNLGFFYFMEQDYPHSLEFLENAIEYTHRVKSERWQIADLEYAIGLVFLFLDRNLSSIEFSKNAVLYFEKNFYYKRAIESYIVLGIVYRRAERYKKATETLQLAKKISIELNIIENYPHIFYCLGTISAQQGELELAIENFKEALSLRSDNLGKITCIYAIMLTYAQKKDKNSVVSWCEKGIKFCMNERESTIEHYIHHFQCYLARFSNSENLEETLMKAILYFKKKKDYPYAHKNSILLAQFYLDNKKYKKSASYFSLANEYLTKKEKRNFMEDI
jgi:tetratricopeptide (TPR) repeat protein